MNINWPVQVISKWKAWWQNNTLSYLNNNKKTTQTNMSTKMFILQMLYMFPNVLKNALQQA